MDSGAFVQSHSGVVQFSDLLDINAGSTFAGNGEIILESGVSAFNNGTITATASSVSWNMARAT